MIGAKDVRTVKEVIRSDGLWRFACGDVFLLVFLRLWHWNLEFLTEHKENVKNHVNEENSLPNWSKICPFDWQSFDLSWCTLKTDWWSANSKELCLDNIWIIYQAEFQAQNLEWYELKFFW